MTRQDAIFPLAFIAIFIPFLLIDAVMDFYTTANAEHGFIMSFVKFAVLSTMGEMIGLRIACGQYWRPGFGLVPRMVVWGVLGVGINAAFIIFSSGIPKLLDACGWHTAEAAFLAPGFSWEKVGVALCISVGVNTLFAPIFMTFHKITDTHITRHGGRLSALVTPVAMAEIFASLDWARQWSFVFKRTIPLFWYPAHTITFMLPPSVRVLFAALLGIALGILLALAARPKK